MDEIKKSGRGGARPGSGRKKKDNGSIIIRMSNQALAEIRTLAKSRGVPVGMLVEDALKRNVL